MKAPRHATLIMLFIAVLEQAHAGEIQVNNNQPLNLLAVSKASDLKGFSERPLFEQSRRRLPPDVTAADAQEDEPNEAQPEFVLLGITTGLDGSIARLTTAGGTTSRSLRAGESIDGWRLQEIEPSSVTLVKDGETVALTIFNDDNARVGDEVGDARGSEPGLLFQSIDAVERPKRASKVRMIDAN